MLVTSLVHDAFKWNVITAPGSAVPSTIGRRSEDGDGGAVDSRIGGDGAVLSLVYDSPPAQDEVFPAASDAFANNAVVVSDGKSVVRVIAQPPFALATPEPTACEQATSENTTTDALPSDVPLTVGLVVAPGEAGCVITRTGGAGAMSSWT